MSDRLLTHELQQCQAKVSEAPHYIHWHRCASPGRFVVNYDGSYTANLCGTHKRLAEKWREEGRIASMVRLYWGLR